MPYSEEWRQAQIAVADYFGKLNFSIRQETSLKSGKRIDILAQKKISAILYHFIIEVKNYQKMTRKQEMSFCKQLQQYVIEFSLEELFGKTMNKNPTIYHIKRNRFIGILCCTHSSHFTHHQLSDHRILRNCHIKGIPKREILAKQITMYSTPLSLLPKVFSKLRIDTASQQQLDNWF